MLCFYFNFFLCKSIKMFEMIKIFFGVIKGLFFIDGVFWFVMSFFVFLWMLIFDYMIFLGLCCVIVLLCFLLILLYNILFVEWCLIVWFCDCSFLCWCLLGLLCNFVRERKIVWLVEWVFVLLGGWGWLLVFCFFFFGGRWGVGILYFVGRRVFDFIWREF